MKLICYVVYANALIVRWSRPFNVLLFKLKKYAFNLKLIIIIIIIDIIIVIILLIKMKKRTAQKW